MLRRYFLLFLLGAGLFINPAAALPAPVTPADPDFNKQDYLKQISANYAWALGTGNAYEVKIAVLDTGVLTNHPDLLVDTARGWDYVDNDSTPNPDPDKSAIYYHGTAVAGIAAAEGNNNEGVTGVAWNARIIPIKVLDNDTLNSTDKIIQGINHAVNNGADIINMSLGIPVLEDIMNDPAVKADLIAQIKQKIPALSLLDDDFIANLAAALISSNVDTAALKEACDNAYNNGILLVAAMGNTTVSGTIPNYGYITLDIPQTVTSYPAGFESVIGVAGVNPDNTIGDGSLYGSGDKTTELAAPYSNMYTTHITKAGNGILIPNYNYVGQGTSYATPVVSGLAALLKGTYPDLTNKEIRKILQITATDMGDPGKDDKYGYGVVNAYNALNILNTAAPPTLVSSIPEDGDSSVTINTPITITVTDDIRVAATASIEVSTDNINIIQSELNYSGGNFTFYPPGDFYYYNDTVFVTFNFANIFGKTAEVTFSFTVAQDNTPPWIGDFTASSATDNVDLQFRVTDNETGVSWSSLEVLINDVLIDETNIGYIDTSTDEGWVSVNFVDSFYYGEFVCVTINISDISGNASSVTWAYQTASPPAPDAPVLDWRDQGLNTTDNQRLIISRPATIDAVEYWNVYYEVNGSAYITENIPVVTESITLEGVSDNQIVTAAILWIAASTNVTSNWSVTTTLNIEDRTPPLATSPLINSANVPSIMSIDILAADEDSGVNPDPASINIEVYSAKHGNIPITISYNSIHPVPYERLFFFNPVEPFMRDNPFYHEGQLVSVNFDYGDTIFVTASIADLAGNTVTLSYSYTTEEDNTPPSLSLNDVSATTVNMQLEFAASDTQTGVSWSALEIIINDSLIDPLNLNIEYINTTNYQGLVSLNFDYNFIQGQIYNVTLNLKDVSGNIGSCAITHIMDIPRPDKPTLEWTDMGLNSMDNQKVIITRPPTLDAVEYWSVYYEINGYAYITENIPAVTESITLEDVLDNQTVTAAILWVAAGTGVQSSWSDAATLNIADRTPPVMLDFSPRSDAPTNSSIAITVTDDSVISADACIEVSTDNVTTINGSLNYANNVFFFEPAQNFYYGDMVYVTLNFADVLGNTTTASFSLDVHRDTTTPYITDIVTASSVSADIVFSIVDDESGVSWNTLKIYNYSNGSSNGSGLIDSTRITVDPASGRVTIDPINNFNYGEGVYLQIRISDIFNNNTTFVIDYDIENPPAPDAPQLIWLDHGLNSGDTQEVIVSPSALLPGVDQWEIRLYANNTEFNRSQLPLPGEGVTLSGIQDEQVVSASIRWIYSGHNAASNWSEEATLNIGDRTAPVVHLRSPLNSLQDPPAAIYIGVTDNSVLSTNIALAVTLNDSPAAGWSYTATEQPNGYDYYGDPLLVYFISPSATLRYGDRVSLDAVIYDEYGNSVNAELCFQVSADTEPPLITNYYSSPQIYADLQVWIRDAKTGVSWNSLTVELNDRIVSSNEMSITDLGNKQILVSVNPVEDFRYGQLVRVTVNVADNVDNWTTLNVSYSYTTEEMPRPDQPVLVWVNSLDINTTDNQLLRVERPGSINYTTHWEITLTTNTETIIISQNLTVSSVNITVSDNQTVTVSIRWIDAMQTNPVYSPYSQWTEQILTDKTPPTLNPATLIPTPGSSEVSITQHISFSLEDTDSAINSQNITVLVNDRQYDYYDLILDNERFVLPVNFEYNDPASVTINFEDTQGNTNYIHYSFQPATDHIPPLIYDILPPTDNSAGLLDSPTTISFKLSDDRSGVNTNNIQILANDLLLSDPVITETPGGYFVEFKPALDFHTTYNVTISVQDIARNEQQVTLNFKTVTTDFHIIENDTYFRNIQEAAQRAPSGSTLEIAPGEYFEKNIEISKSITIRPAFGAVTLNGENTGRHFTLRGARVTIDSVNLLNGYAENGGSIWLSGADLSLSNATLYGNHAQQRGGVIYADTAAGSIQLTAIRAISNRASAADGSIYAAGTPSGIGNIVIKDSLFAENKTYSNGLFFNANSLTALRTDFLKNQSEYGTLFYCGAVLLENCTIYDNTNSDPGRGTIAEYNSVSNVTIKNSIVWKNGTGKLFGNTISAEAYNSNIPTNGQNFSRVDCISQEPGLSDPDNYLVTLTSSDPGIDLGTMSVTDGDKYIYDAPDMGSKEYSSIFISNIQPAPGSVDNSITPTLSFIVRDQHAAIDTGAIRVTVDGRAYSASITDLNPGGSTYNIKAEVKINDLLPYTSAIPVNLLAQNTAGDIQVKNIFFYTRDEEVDDLLYVNTPNSGYLLSEQAHRLEIKAVNIYNNAMSNRAVSFKILSETANPPIASLVSPTVIATTNAQGIATITLNAGAGSSLVTLQAAADDISKNFTITLNPVIRVAKNTTLDKAYLTIQAALDEARAGDIIVIADNYAAAEPAQKLAVLTWPAVNNLTLQANLTTINAQIKIQGNNITARIERIVFANNNNSSLEINASGTSVINITSCNFVDNSSLAIDALQAAYLNISDCSFNNNNNNNHGGAINVSNASRLKISGSKFQNNKSTNGNGGAVYLNYNIQQAEIKSSLFENNLANNGTAIYGSIQNLELLLENSIIARHTGSAALYLSNFKSATLNFSTIVSNDAVIYVDSANTLNIINSILWNNQNDIAGTAVFAINSFVPASVPGIDNKHLTDPLLDGDYAPDVRSPALNSASANYAVATDYAGKSRPLLGGYDIGARELSSATGIVAIIPGKDIYATIQAALDDAAAGETIIVLEGEHNLTSPLYWPNTNAVKLQGLSQETRLKGDDWQKPLISNTQNVDFILENLTIVSFNNVIVQPQQLASTNQITLNNLILLDNYASASSKNGAILNTLYPANLVLRNSRLDNNRAESNGGLFYTKNGKSIITISSANISNASLTNDSMEGSLAYNAEVHLYQVTVNMTGSHTGIAFANSRVSADWSTFIGGKPRGNSSRSGIFYNSEVTLNRVLIKGSRANLQGVGIFDTCRIYVDHSIFHGNEEDGGNAPNAIARNTSGNILNSVFLNNGGSQDLPDNTAITVSHSSAAPNRGIAAANGNILTVNPAFINPAAGDYRVSFNSPLIDKGTQVYSGDIYDATDIGLYEYQDTHFSHYAPLPETGSIATSQSITIRIRNNKRRIELTDGNIILRINDIRYPLATLNITVTDNTLAAAVDPTDFYITFTPSPNFHYGSVITVDLTVSSGVPAETVRRIYNLYTEKPQNIYVSSSGNDGYNDGAPDRPLRTIARAMELASDDTKIFLSGEVFAEDVIWPNKKNISIAGTWNTTISGNIDLTALPPAVSGNIARIILNGQLTNSGLLSIDTLLSTSNAAAGLVNNSGAQIYMQNSVLANKGTALSNAGGLKIIYSNIVSNNTALENTGSAEIINSIMYKNNTLATGSFSDINNLTGDPLFVDDSFLAIAFNSPAVDAAADSVQVSLDYRELPRPEHHLPDIGAYESDKPNLILISPQEKDAVPVTLSWEFSVVENPDKISTENIKIRLVTDNQTQTISVNYTATATGYTLHALPRPLLDTNTTYDLIVTAENNSGNIVEISVNLHTEPDITELFVSTQNHALGEVGHADYPFTSIQKALDYIVRKKLPQATLNIAEAVYKERLTLPNNPGLSQNIHILGNASTLNAEAAGRGFTIGANYRITMQNFSLINGRANNNTGGAIQNNGAELLLEEVYFSDNQANDDGGAIYNTGEIILRYSAFTGNGTSDTGGAIYNTGKMRLEQVIFENNSAEFSGGGIYNNGGHLYGIEIKALNNRSKSTGGFLYSFRDSAATLENSLLRNNQASTAGGGIYNRGAITINNSIFDYNTLTGGSGSSTSGGGAIYNSGNDDGNMLNIYQSSFVSNDAGTARGGAIFNYGNGSSAKISIYNSLFVLNKSSDSSAIQGNMASAMPGKLLNSYPSVANGPTDPEHTLLNNVALYDYTPLAGSPLIDTGLDLSAVAGIVTSNDYAGKPRPMGGGYEIGALEHKVSILIPPGYYAHDEYGNTADFTPTSTVTIGRYINGQQVGFITIPSANNINYESVPFNHIEITPNQIVIPAESMPGSKQYVLELYSPEKYPFISANGVLLSDYAGNITANAYLTGNAVISPTGAPQAGYLMRVEAVQPGIFELVHPEHLSFAPANLLGNHYTTANFEVAVRDKYGAILSGVPVSLSVAAGGGAVTPNSTTSNAMYTHGAAGSATINGQYAALTADLPVITLADDDPPVITLDQPTDINNAPITHNIIFTVSDADSGIASWSFWFAGEDRTASLSVTGSGQFEYAPNFALDTTYAITISASDLVGNATTITRDIHTKMDTDGPVILAYPAPGTRNVLPEEPLSFRIQDFESGVRADSLQLLVSTADGQVLSLTPITESPDAHTLLVTYNHPDFELGTTVSVTLNIKDISGNESSLTYSYTIALDSTPPTVAILAPSQGESTSNVVTLSFTVSDKTSDIDLNSLEVWLTTTTANSSTVKIDAASINILPQDNAKQLTANVLLTLEYGAQVIVNVRAKDDCGIEGSATLNFQTIPDTTAPAIQIISPAPDTTVSLNTPIIIEVTDTETGVNLSWLALQVNGTILAPHTPPVPISNGYRAEYRPALNYQSQAAVIVSVRDNAYPQTNLNTLSYAFQIEADTYPPEKPTLNAITGIATNNFNALYIPLSGEVEPDNDLLIYINDVKITENYYSASEFKLTLNVQELKTKLQLASAPATLHITAVARDRAQIPNASQASAPTRAVVLVDNYFADAGFSGVEVFVPAGTFAEDITINIASPNPGTYELPDNLTMVYIIDISAPANRQPVGNGKVRITLPLPATGNNYDVYHYDEQRAEWSKIESRVSGDTIVFESNQLSLFGIGSINNATQLAEYEMILAPNPVKLASEPLHFVYKVPHNSSAEVRIYTINGRLLSKFNKDLFTGLNEFTWTGENNFNETIGNGVYLVYIRIEDQITGEKKIIRSKIAVLN